MATPLFIGLGTHDETEDATILNHVVGDVVARVGLTVPCGTLDVAVVVTDIVGQDDETADLGLWEGRGAYYIIRCGRTDRIEAEG